MAAGTIIDIKAGMEYDNAPTLSITTFFMLWRFTRLHQFRVALRVKVFFFIIRAVRSDSRSPVLLCVSGIKTQARGQMPHHTAGKKLQVDNQKAGKKL